MYVSITTRKRLQNFRFKTFNLSFDLQNIKRCYRISMNDTIDISFSLTRKLHCVFSKKKKCVTAAHIMCLLNDINDFTSQNFDHITVVCVTIRAQFWYALCKSFLILHIFDALRNNKWFSYNVRGYQQLRYDDGRLTTIKTTFICFEVHSQCG